MDRCFNNDFMDAGPFPADKKPLLSAHIRTFCRRARFKSRVFVGNHSDAEVFRGSGWTDIATNVFILIAIDAVLIAAVVLTLKKTRQLAA